VLENFRRGLALASESLDVFRAHPRLGVLPFCSFLVQWCAFAIAAVALLRYDFVGTVFANDVYRYGALFVWIGVGSSLGTFFGVAVSHCAFQYFEGEDPRVGDGLRAAWRARRAILVWAVTAATVGMVLQIIQEKLGWFGPLARLGFDVGWGVLTFFVVPVIVVEDTASVRELLSKSGDAFTETWGESVSVTFGIAALMTPFSLLAVGCLVVAYVAVSGPMAMILGGFGLLVLVAAIVTSNVLRMVARSALYEYAIDERQVGPFADRDPSSVIGDR
jgi:hypothetical protein